MQRLHDGQPIRIIDRAIQNFTGAGLGGWIIMDGNVKTFFEGAGRKCHKQGNVVAETSKLACVTGRTLCGKVRTLGVRTLGRNVTPVCWCCCCCSLYQSHGSGSRG